MSAALDLRRVGHAYFGQSVLSGITLSIGAGEVVALVGPSGSGKSTLAQIAAGLTDVREGRVTRGYARRALVFQDPRLLPWATARANIAFALGRSGLPRDEWPARVEQAAAMAELEPEDLAKYPIELSGGMRQRVAIARALVVEPDSSTGYFARSSASSSAMAAACSTRAGHSPRGRPDRRSGKAMLSRAVAHGSRRGS